MSAHARVVAEGYLRFVAAGRRHERASRAPAARRPGELAAPILVAPEKLSELLRIAVREACGLAEQGDELEVIWTRGDSELAIDLREPTAVLGEGLLAVRLPVRCDQARGQVTVPFAVGSEKAPAGLFAATLRRPLGPLPVVAAWGDAVLAFAWSALLHLVTGLSGAAGRDERGELLVPVELSASKQRLMVAPMARHRLPDARSADTRGR